MYFKPFYAQFRENPQSTIRNPQYYPTQFGFRFSRYAAIPS